MGKILIKCDNCGKEFEKYESKLGKHNFCCRKCYSIFHSKDVPQCKCTICGKNFKGDKYNANKYCSWECYLKDHAIKDKERVCPKCGKKFIAKTSTDKYCSWECYNTDRHMPKGEEHWNWKGGISKNNDRHDSNEYKEWRQAVYERDKYKCVKCGSKEKINAHHILSWKYYPEQRYNINNGITLCEKCHIELHQKYGYDTNEPIDYKEKKILPKGV